MIADGAHARADSYVSLAVIASAAVVAIGLPIADPLIGLAITLVILRITWQSWRTVRDGDTHHDHDHDHDHSSRPSRNVAFRPRRATQPTRRWRRWHVNTPRGVRVRRAHRRTSRARHGSAC